MTPNSNELVSQTLRNPLKNHHATFQMILLPPSTSDYNTEENH